MFICADTEDNSRELLESGQSGFEKQLTQVAAITRDGKRWHGRGKDSGKHFLEWLARQPEQFCYFHNTQYDLGALFGDSLDKLDITLVGGRLIKAVWPQKRGQPKFFLDSFNIWPMSVAKLAPAFGLQKLAFDKASREYVFRDVEIIHAAMDFAWKLAEAAGFSVCPTTYGSFGVKLWKEWGARPMPESLWIAKQALYGGRVELFRVQNESGVVCHTDINSLYPFAMLNNFPGLLEPWGKKLPEWGLATVTINIPDSFIAPLPLRREDGRIFYHVGKIKGTWVMPEIVNAVQQGAKILKVHEAYGTTEFFKPYNNFMQRVYKARLSAQSEAEKVFFKFMMNSLYGRLGSEGVISRSVWQTERNRWKGVPYGNKVLVSYRMPLGEEVNWTHCAYLTAYARLEIQKYLRLVGEKRLIYCDTDSAVFDCPDKKIPFETGLELGQMKLEGWHSEAHTWAPKTYNIGPHWKAKGVPQRLAKEFILTGHACYDMPFRMREAIAFYDPENLNGKKRARNTKKLGVWRTVEKYMRSGYDRKVLKGNVFYPCKVLQH